MCGIVGYIGKEDAKQIIIDGLKTLEYRGYDSSGLALINKEDIIVYREVGRIANLEKKVIEAPISEIGIGHTRWATHGKPSIENSHPHSSMKRHITLVHNGVIENYMELKEELIAQGYTFDSQTDTEVIANFLEAEYLKTKDMKQAIQNLIKKLDGSYALGIMCSDEKDRLYCAKNKVPLLAGLGEGFNMIGSDAMAMIKKTNNFIEIQDLEFLIIDQHKIEIFDKDGQKIIRESFESNINSMDIDLGNYDHYMIKEINEQPTVIRNLMQRYLTEDDVNIDPRLLKELIDADRIYIVASGTSMHAGLIGKSLIEALNNKPVEVHIGSEFGYHLPIISEKPFFIFISQSGETADSRVALQALKPLKHPTLTITNVAGSTLSRESDYTLLLEAGPEVAVASTKAYVAQVTLLSILANAMAGCPMDLNFELSKTALAIEDVISKKDQIKKLAEDNLMESRNCFYLGRNTDYYVALEAALKLKEISYIQTEGFASGELKHGTIALIEEGTPVIGLISQAKVALNTRSALQEVAARGAKVMVIAQEDVSKNNDDFVFSNVHHLLSPLPLVVVTQFIAYYTALIKGFDIDKPRNLAKSVTVE